MITGANTGVLNVGGWEKCVWGYDYRCEHWRTEPGRGWEFGGRYDYRCEHWRIEPGWGWVGGSLIGLLLGVIRVKV